MIPPSRRIGVDDHAATDIDDQVILRAGSWPQGCDGAAEQVLVVRQIAALARICTSTCNSGRRPPTPWLAGMLTKVEAGDFHSPQAGALPMPKRQPAARGAARRKT